MYTHSGNIFEKSHCRYFPYSFKLLLTENQGVHRINIHICCSSTEKCHHCKVNLFPCRVKR